MNNEENESSNQLLFILKQRQQEVGPLLYHNSSSSLTYPTSHKNSELLSFEHPMENTVRHPSNQVSFNKQISSPMINKNTTTIYSKPNALMANPKQLKKEKKKSPIQYKQENKSLNASKKESFKYVSPFILIAEQRAKERARKALATRSRNAATLATQSWNDDTSTPSLFDPSLKKQELFKVQPRKPNAVPLQQDGKSDSLDSLSIDIPALVKRSPSQDQKSNKLTIRSFGVSPSRRPLSPPHSPNMYNKLDDDRQEFRDNSPGKHSSGGGERVSTSTSPIHHRSQSSPIHYSAAPAEPAVTRATSPMDSKVLQDIFGDSDHVFLRVGTASMKASGTDNEVETAKNRQRHIDSLGSPIRLPEYRSPISTPANNNIDESTSPFIAAMNATVDNALRELKDTLASKVHPSAAISPYRKHKTVHTSPMESNFHYPALHSATATDHMMASMADLMKAVGGIISNSNTDRKRSHSPHSHRRRRESRHSRSRSRSRSRSVGRENDSPIQYERLVNGRPEYAAPGPFHRHDELQGDHLMPLNGLESAPLLETGSRKEGRKKKKTHLVVDIAGNILQNDTLQANDDGDSPSSIFDAIIAKLQSIEQSESEMLRYLANSVSTGQQSDSADRRIAQSTRCSDKDAANITKLPGGNSNFNHRRYVNTYEAPDQAGEISSSFSILEKDSAPPITAAAHHRQDMDDHDRDLVVGNSRAAAAAADLQGTPTIASTHENALSNYMDTLPRGDSSNGSGSGLGWLALLGVSTKVSRDKVHRQERRERVREKELAYLNQFPRLKEADLDCGFSHDAILNYRNELARARQLKDVPFMSRGVTMSDVADSLGREITDQVVRGVCEEVDQYLNELTDSLINKI